VHWREYEDELFKGIWVIKEPMRKPDVVLYYAHGGGFSMGSSYFYLEFLLSWLSLLSEAGYRNPAIFALEYTLVPDASFPTQLFETIAGYKHVLTVARDPSIVCVGGDSAGGTLILSLLLYLADSRNNIGKPALAVLISPWVTLDSPRHQNNTSDYLDASTLRRYGELYAGNSVPVSDLIISPGNCKDIGWWQRASPSKGIFITYGSEEVFEPEIKEFTRLLQKAGVVVTSQEEAGGIHAWPVASLFLSRSSEKRFKGLRSLVKMIRDSVHPENERGQDGVGILP
jgi:acetyl esterase/lipase